MFRKFVVTSVRRAWIAFAALTVFGFVMTLVLGYENPLRSDDPYLNGFLPGLVVGAMSLVYSIAEALCRSRWRSTFCYGLALCAWAAFILAATFESNEGKEMGRVLAAGSIAAGAIGWPLFAFRIPRALEAILTLSAVAILAMYGLLMVRWTWGQG